MSIVKTEAELLDRLIASRVMLSKKLQDYLENLIKLEFSAVKEGIINNEEKIALAAEFPLYRDIARYNICERTIKLINSQNIKPEIIPFDKSYLLALSSNNKYHKLFSFDYEKSQSDESDIGNINLCSYNQKC